MLRARWDIDHFLAQVIKKTNIGAVTASIRKTEGSDDTLTAILRKGGEVLSSQSTNAHNGGASSTVKGF